ncbi:MAG: hypothetical protein LBT46_10085 [Planctomycetaceae bacterium]|jgi:DNA-directed RNA polymerase subunit M/transcription elongation factor TFIIS|nr:hypothetical protein [Planctomycetaceae bacterium]
MKKIRFHCLQCQHLIEVSFKAAGESIFCPACFAPVTVPNKSTVRTAEEENTYGVDEQPVDVRELTDRITLSLLCSVCRTNISVTQNQIGTTLHCPECYMAIVVPESIIKKPAAQNFLPPKPDKPVYGLRAAGNVPLDKTLIGFHCQLCGTLMYASASEAKTLCICPDCGTQNTVPSRPKAVLTPAALPAQTFEGGSTFGVAAAPSLPAVVNSKEPLVPVVCGLCGTRMYALESEIGGTKKCPDCGRTTEIKFVPKEHRVSLDMSGDGYGVSNEEAATRPVMRVQTDYRYVDGSIDKAVHPLKYAQWNKDKADGKKHLARLLPLPKYPFWTRFFTAFMDSRMIFQTLLTGFLLNGGVILYLIQPGLNNEFSALLSFCYGIISFLFGCTVLGNLVQSVFSYTASGIDTPERDSYIDYHPFDATVYAFWMFLLLIFSATPGFFAANLLFGTVSAATLDGIQPVYHSVFMSVSLLLSFPVFFLSSVQSNSYFEVLTKDIVRSLFFVPLIWLRFYFLSLLLFFTFFFLDWGLSVLIVSPLIQIIITGFLLSFIAAVYFRLLGRLALALS